MNDDLDAFLARLRVFLRAGVRGTAVAAAAGLRDRGVVIRSNRGTVIPGPVTIRRLHAGMDKIAAALQEAK